jgi:hypothetical protein
MAPAGLEGMRPRARDRDEAEARPLRRRRPTSHTLEAHHPLSIA